MNDEAKIIPFRRVVPSASPALSLAERDELADLVRSVLAPSELFKLQVKKRKSGKLAEIVSFHARAKSCDDASRLNEG